MKWLFLLLPLVLPASLLFAQGRRPEILRIASAYTSFPDSAREKGHLYDGEFYDEARHYRDSSVILLIPPGFRSSLHPDFVFWFHGWRNTIDSSLLRFRLDSQFIASGKNAILVLAETARNSPDSYGGKLENPGIFALLLGNILGELRTRKIIPPDARAGHVLLAGHSGAYRVIGYILKNGGVSISEVDLFDALYWNLDIFQAWIQSAPDKRFVNWYTNQGGTDDLSMTLLNDLEREHLPVLFGEEEGINLQKLRSTRIIFLHSARGHNDIIDRPDHFQLLLEASPFLFPN